MLQRAASNAYSWWWASHIRTKQSKWLEENLHDMEEKVTSMLKIIENSGDSFAQRAEMYYRKRPELVNIVEDSYRAYRSLAERYDKLSRDLQSANRTIATAFPEQVQYITDEDDDEDTNPTTSSTPDGPIKEDKIPRANIPKVPIMPKKEFRSQSMLLSRKGQLNRTASSAKAVVPPSSGLSEYEARMEIDRLHKEILALQTENEFVQSICERCHAKCWKIENQITDMQANISSLQDEFGIHNVIDDNEARNLMAATALKSCKDTLVKLQGKQEQSTEESRVENQRIKEVHRRLTTLKSELLSRETDLQEPTDEQEDESESINHHDLQLLREKVKKELEADSKSTLTVIQLAEKIDELVNKVANLETAVSSQSALVIRLRSQTDGLHLQIKTLEEDKESLKENSENMSKKLTELEEELRRVKNLNQSVKDQNNNLHTRFTEASCNIDHLSEKLQTMKPDEELENMESIQEVKAAPDAEADRRFEEQEEKPDPSNNIMENQEKKDDAPVLSNSVKAEESDKNLAVTQGKEDEKKHMSETGSTLDTELEEPGTDEEDNRPNWKHLFRSGSEDREKLLLEEYTLVLENYKEVRKKLGDVEKKNRDGFFELALQIRELKNALAIRDEEIQSLRKMSSPRKNDDENHPINLTEYKYSHQEGSPESMTQAASFLDSNLSSLICSPQRPVFDSAGEHHNESGVRIDELAAPGRIRKDAPKEARNEIKVKHAVSAIEDKFRSDIDDMLEENLEFWLRFSTSFHQIRKFQTSVHDLKEELSKLMKDNRKHDGSGKSQFLISETRPIYKHLREIQTDLTLWLENNSVLKDELQSRYASLCNIQEELSRVSHANSREEAELSQYQAAKFQGEILNMKQESNKVADELKAGLDLMKGLKVEAEDILAKLDQDLGISACKQRSSSFRARIPLRSFLFGVKLKKQKQKPSIFSCVSPALQKQYSDMAAAGKIPQ